MAIELACDYTIWLERYYRSRTYEDHFHVRWPNDRIHQAIISKAKITAKKILGDWPGLFLSPEIKIMRWTETSFPVLPVFLCMGLFMSVKCTGNHSGTRLNIVWFQNDPDNFISKKAMSKIKNINWPEYARDF